MPPKKATAAGAPPAPARTSTRARKPTTPPTDNQPKDNKRQADESDEESKAKKSKLVNKPAPKKQTKSASKTKPTATNPKPIPAKATKLAKISATAPNTTGTKRKASDDEDIEAPQLKKSKTTAKPTAKAPTTKRAPKKAATLKKSATPKPAPAAQSENASNKATAPEKAVAPKEVSAPIQKKARGRPATKKPVAATTKVAPTKVTEPKSAPKVKAPKPAKAAKPPKPVKELPTINATPTQRLDVLVFGEGSGGELGLGAKHCGNKKVVDVSRPRLNQLLSAKDVGVVQIAVGGMHCAALTHDNKILTWGVNDQGALGRPTGAGPMKDMKADDASESDSEDEDEDSGLNPDEATPLEVDPQHFAAGTKFVSLYAGDSSTFALTTTGLVYGWGTFRGNDGIVGFRPGAQKGDNQATPMLIPELKSIVDIATGTNHVLALDTKGRIYVWGTGEQNQLGRRVIERTSSMALRPAEIGLKRKKIVSIGSGDYHSFAIDDKDNLYSWGLNSFGQTGIPKIGKDEDIVGTPTLVKNLKDFKLKQVTGGSHHTIACTVDGQVLKWGRVESYEAGFDCTDLPDDEVYKENGKPRYLKKPKAVPGLQGAIVATANDTCIVVTPDGTAYSWGFSEGYQTGLGVAGEVRNATQIDNTAVRAENLVWCGVGGQFGVLGGVPKEEATSTA